MRSACLGAASLLLGVAAVLSMRPAFGAGEEVAAVEADLDGDGGPDRAVIVAVRPTKPPRSGAFVVQGTVGGQTSTFGPLEAVAPKNLGREFSEAQRVRDLQMLPPQPLAALDCNMDGRVELVVRFRLPMSRANVETSILAWDREARDLVRLWHCPGSDGVLCVDTTGNGTPALFPYVLEAGLPVFSQGAYEWEEGEYRERRGALPDRLARVLVPIYAQRHRYAGRHVNWIIMGEHVRAALAVGDEIDALGAVDGGLRELAREEKEIRDTRPRLLLLRGDLYAGLGSQEEALKAYREAYGLGGWDGFASADGFAAFHFARARVAKGDRYGALHWLHEAERHEEAAGKFDKLREQIPAE